MTGKGRAGSVANKRGGGINGRVGRLYCDRYGWSS